MTEILDEFVSLQILHKQRWLDRLLDKQPAQFHSCNGSPDPGTP